MKACAVLLAVWAGTWAQSAAAIGQIPRCDVYPGGSDKASAVIPCVFALRQCHITIIREDGVTHELTPVADAPGKCRDQEGRTVTVKATWVTRG